MVLLQLVIYIYTKTEVNNLISVGSGSNANSYTKTESDNFLLPGLWGGKLKEFQWDSKENRREWKEIKGKQKEHNSKNSKNSKSSKNSKLQNPPPVPPSPLAAPSPSPRPLRRQTKGILMRFKGK